MLRGIGTSKGIGIGKALIIHKCKNAVSRVKIKDTEAEVDKFNEAVKKFIQETNELVDKLSQKLNGDDKNALVLKNQEYLIRDPEFTSGVISAITNDKLNAEAAVEDTCEMLKNIFLSFNNDTMTQRVADIEDMKQRLIAIMQGQKHIDLTKLSDNTVWNDEWQKLLEDADILLLKWMGAGLDTPFFKKLLPFIKKHQLRYYIDAAGTEEEELVSGIEKNDLEK